MVLSSCRGGNPYCETEGGENARTFKMTVRSKKNHSSETIKEVLKATINPIELRVGINTFKTLNNGRVMIETNSKEEIEALEKYIHAKCGGDLRSTSIQ
jgi:hypothetical protein